MDIITNIPVHNRGEHVKLQKLQKFLLESAQTNIKILESILERQDTITKNPGREYKTHKGNVSRGSW